MDKPILFQGEMVRAILTGTKTQTRRIVKWESLHKQAGLPFPTKCRLAWFKILRNWGLDADDGVMREVHCPFGKPGDQLWIREAWAMHPDPNEGIIYRADDWDEWFESISWKPSIHMKKVHSRIRLRIISIRVERLRDISNNDAWCEGVSDSPEYNCRALFFDLWEKINGEKEGCSVNDNPWVWVIEFEKLDLRARAQWSGTKYQEAKV